MPSNCLYPTLSNKFCKIWRRFILKDNGDRDNTFFLNYILI